MRSLTPFSLRFTFFLLSTLFLSSPALAHMNLFRPIPRTHQANPFTTDATVDYDIMAPLSPPKKPFPCGGTKQGPSVQNFKAGENMNVVIEGHAPHDGGHCEFSISYDGQHFVALRTIIRTCLQDATRSFSIPLPSTLPGGRAIFSWSWVNSEGNREFYQNCADINIDGPSTGTLTGPPIVVANLPGFPTIPEMNIGLNDRRDLYFNRSSIEIGPNGFFKSQSTVVSTPPVQPLIVSPSSSNSNTSNPYSPPVQKSRRGNERDSEDLRSPDFIEQLKNRIMNSRLAQTINATLAENGIYVSVDNKRPRIRRGRSP